jgi:hypothetical protein
VQAETIPRVCLHAMMMPSLFADWDILGKSVATCEITPRVCLLARRTTSLLASYDDAKSFCMLGMSWKDLFLAGTTTRVYITRKCYDVQSLLASLDVAKSVCKPGMS